MQMAVIEAARDLVGIAKAGSTEFGPSEEPVVGLMTEWMRGNELEKRRAERRSRRHHAARRLSGRAGQGQPGGQDLRRHADLRAPPPPLRGEHALSRAAGGGGRALLRHVARRPAARDHRAARPSLVHRRAVPPGAEVAPLRAAPAVRELHRTRRWSRAGWFRVSPRFYLTPRRPGAPGWRQARRSRHGCDLVPWHGRARDRRRPATTRYCLPCCPSLPRRC